MALSRSESKSDLRQLLVSLFARRLPGIPRGDWRRRRRYTAFARTVFQQTLERPFRWLIRTLALARAGPGWVVFEMSLGPWRG